MSALAPRTSSVSLDRWKKGRWKQVAWSTAALVAAFLYEDAGAAATVDLNREVAFNIPSQPLDAALIEFSRQADVQLAISAASLERIQSPGLNGTLAAGTALTRLLSQTSLAFYTVGSTVTVAPAAANSATDHPTRLAQTAPATNAPALPTSGGQSSFSTSDQSADTSLKGLQEVLVTAQKRQERLIDVPQSVSVLSSDTIAELGAVQFRDFASSVPGLSFKTGGAGYNQISLRGVTTGTEASPTVGIYVDEVPFGSSTAFAFAARFALDMGLFDVDRIEVLRGPQGTLYGASSMGGLLKYVTKQPDTKNFTADIQSGISDTHDGGVNYNASIVVNAPVISDTVAVRASLFESHDGGFIDNVELGQNDINRSNVYGGRASLLITPTESLSINISGFLQNISRKGESTADYDFTGVPLSGELNQVRGFAEQFDQKFRVASGTIVYDFDWAKLTSITSYQTVKSAWVDDLSGQFVPLLSSIGLGSYGAVADAIALNTDKTTQELRLSSKETGLLEWVLGGFYTHETSCDCEDFLTKDLADSVVPNDLLNFALPTKFKEYAVFGDLTWHLTSQFEVTGGLRDAHNSQVFTQNATGAFGAVSPTIRSSENVLNYLGNASYHFSDHATAYLRYATGYRPGGPSIVERDPVTGAPSGPATFGADKLKSYEVGLKAETFDRRYGIELATYYIDWANIQLSTTVGSFGTFTNASGPAHIQGSELTLTARPIQGLTTSGAFAFQHAYLVDADPILGAAKGERLPNSPRFTAGLNADYVFIESGLRPTVGGTFQYITDRMASFNESTHFAQYRLPAYTSVDVRSGLVIAAEEPHPVSLQLYVHNLFDQRGQLAAQTQFGKAQVAILQPRTIGISAITHF